MPGTVEERIGWEGDGDLCAGGEVREVRRDSPGEVGERGFGEGGGMAEVRG